MKKLNNKGFSLVELIIVIAIMVVLVGVLAPQFIKYVESSRQSTDIQNVAELRAAIEAYVADANPGATETITITVASNVITITGTGTICADATKGIAKSLESIGLSATTTAKSTGWPDGTYATYNCGTYKWSHADSTPALSGAKKTNDKAPKKDLNEAFK